MADGTIVFSTALDNGDLEKQLKDVEARIKSLKKSIESDEDKKTLIEKEMERSDAAIDATLKKIHDLNAEMAELGKAPVGDSAAQARRAELSAELKQTESLYEKQAKARDGLSEKWEKANDAAQLHKQKLKEAEQEYAELSAESKRMAADTQGASAKAGAAIRNGVAQSARSAAGGLSGIASGMAATWSAVASRIRSVLLRAFPFAIIIAGAAKVISAVSQMVAENEQFKASAANLKAVFDGFISVVASAVLPVITGFVNMLAGVFERIAGLIDMIFGSNIVASINQQRQMAAATNAQASAARNLATEQKKANRELMSFDELNRLSDDDEAPTPSYETPSASAGSPAAEVSRDAGIFQGLLDWMDGIWDRIANDAEGPFARIREGLNLIKQGWQEVVQGISTGDWKLVWKGIGDIVIGALYTIEGAFGAFMDWLDEITGGRFSGVFQGLEQIVHGFVSVVEGLLRGDLSLAFSGLVDIVEGIALTLSGAVNGIIGLATDAVSGLFDWLSEKFPELAPIFQTVKGAFVAVLNAISAVLNGVVGAAKNIVLGALNVIVGIFTLDGETIMAGFTQIGEGFMGLFNGICDGIMALLVPFCQWFVDSVVTPLSEAFGAAWDAIVDAAGDAWDGIQDVFSSVADFFSGIFGAAWGAVKDAFTAGGEIFDGVVDAIVGAFKTLANNVIGGLNWAIAQPFNGINGIIRALKGWEILDFHPFAGFYEIPVPSIPYLAQGAVIPPNREFMAVLGDQSNGRNLEAPESLIRQIVREEAGGGNGQAVALLASILDAVREGSTIYVDREVLGRTAGREIGALARMSGV